MLLRSEFYFVVRSRVCTEYDAYRRMIALQITIMLQLVQCYWLPTFRPCSMPRHLINVWESWYPPRGYYNL